MTDQIITFEAGNVTQTHRIIINNDTECEILPENENFFSNLALNTDNPDIFVIEPRATVTIDDTAEPECGRSVSQKCMSVCSSSVQSQLRLDMILFHM